MKILKILTVVLFVTISPIMIVLFGTKGLKGFFRPNEWVCFIKNKKLRVSRPYEVFQQLFKNKFISKNKIR